MKDLFVLFPIDLYKDYSYLQNCKVILVEHPKFFDRHSKLFGSMKLNILKPVYHRVAMQSYLKYLKSHKIDVKYVNMKDDWVQKVRKELNKVKGQLKFFDPVDRTIELEMRKNFDSYDVINTPRFILEYADMQEYTNIKGSLRQTSFYNWMRKKTGILMKKSGTKNLTPEGGKLTYDSENRNPPYPGMIDDMSKNNSPIGAKSELDLSGNTEVKDAVKYVIDNIPESHLYILNGSYSDLKANSYYLKSIGLELRFPYDHDGADSRLKFFITHKLKYFGEYQDAIIGKSENQEELRSFIYHSGLSVMMNVGLITPKKIIDTVLQSYSSKSTSEKKNILNDTEGYIRQILGWREFCRYTYEFQFDKYLDKNYFNAHSQLTKSWYDGTTQIVPVDNAIEKAFRFGYLHHIERLMIIANWMVLQSIDPKDMFKWFTEFSLDSYDWVMEYNVFAMGSYSDGGNFTTKPYISSSNYIFKMSDYPSGQVSDVWSKVWDLAFWKFMKKHSKKIKKINRLSMLVKLADSNIKKLSK